MDGSIHIKYLTVNEQDRKWGIAVHSVGCQEIAPGAPYPPPNHPARYLFSVERGRILQEYQLLYIASGAGRFRSSATGGWIPVKEGTFFLLYPGQWHSYHPDSETGWREYWVGFDGSIIDERVAAGYFPSDHPLLRVGLQEEIIALYEEAIGIAMAQKSGFQPLLGSIVVHLLGLGYYFDRQEAFSEMDAVINRAKIIVGEEFRTITPAELARRLNMGYSNFRRMV